MGLLESDARARVAVFVAWGNTGRVSLRASLDALLTGSQLWRLISAVRRSACLPCPLQPPSCRGACLLLVTGH